MRKQKNYSRTIFNTQAIRNVLSEYRKQAPKEDQDLTILKIQIGDTQWNYDNERNFLRNTAENFSLPQLIWLLADLN